MSVPADRHPSAPPAATARAARIAPLAIMLLVGAVVVVMGWYEQVQPASLIAHRSAIDAFVSEHRWAALAAFAGLYAVMVALSLPGGALLTIGGGIVFGGFAGGCAALVGATAGAMILFLVAKSALGGWLVRRAGRRAEQVAAGFRAHAFNYLLFLRLVPVFPFWLVNLVPAVCGVRLATFVGATVLGIIPATFAFAYFGAGLDRAVAAQEPAYRACVAAGGAHCRLGFDPSAAASPQLIAALAVLGVLALIPVAVKHFKSGRSSAERPGP